MTRPSRRLLTKTARSVGLVHAVCWYWRNSKLMIEVLNWVHVDMKDDVEKRQAEDPKCRQTRLKEIEQEGAFAA